MKRITLTALALLCTLAGTAMAQQTTGNITGRITDAQGAAVPGVAVTAKSAATGFSRTDTSDSEGVYRLTALPVGTYELRTELTGFSAFDQKDVVVNVAQTTDLNISLKVAGLTESVSVTGESPMIQTTSSSVGGVVDVGRIESLPLNGRQFANLAATIPGVGLGFHTDPTKSTQFSPQINGGNGRNVNYQIDGGDNNDDTVGGLLQLFPLEAIREFNVQTARYKAEYGRSNGGVMNIVTKSGTNNLSGSFFTLFRDTAMNAKTETEKLNQVDKQDYRRYQYGGSFGGPIARDKVHYFAAAERTQQDTFQAVDTSGLFPSLDGIYGTPYRENLITGKVTANLNAAQYLSVRYGHNTNSQPYGTDPQTPPSAWGQSENKLKSFNVNHNWVLAGSRLNEFIFQVAVFRNHIAPGSTDPYQLFPNGVAVGQAPSVPQTTEQTKWQFRDDFSWHATGMGGLGHDFKVGVNFINEPRLFLTFNSGTNDYAYTHLDNDVNGPISDVTLNGGAADANVPTKQTALYVQDDWRVSDRLTLNLGLRYDLNTGFAIDQSLNRNFLILQEAGRSGRLQGIVGFEDFGKEPKEDRDNVQPRVGFAYDVRGDGSDIVRGGWGIYNDFGYTNANILFAALNAVGGSGQIFNVSNSSGLRNRDGSFFRFGQPVSNIASPNEADPNNLLNSHIASPRIKQPYARQASIGWSHQIGASTVVDADYVHTDGRDLGWRPRLNQRPPGQGPTGVRSLADLGISPANFRLNVSQGRSTYDGLNVGVRQRMTKGVSFNGWYSLSRAKSTTGNSSDELDSNNIVNHLDPFADVQEGPSLRSDARHRFTFSGVFALPYGLQVSPIFRFRSALPVALTEGVDLNQDGVNNDLPTTAVRFDGFDDAGNPKLKELGPCKTVNCGRGTSFSQLNLRLSKSFRLVGRARVEAIGEVFNVLNRSNPSGFLGRRLLGSIGSSSPNPDYLRPTEYAGDFQNPEQRVGQIGFRFTF